MFMRSWLKSLSGRFFSDSRKRSPRNRRPQVVGSAMIEMLESRQLLAAAPVLASIETTPLAYTEGTTVPLTGTLGVTDADSANLASAKVTISANYQSGEDILSFTNTALITGSFNAATGILTLTGSDTVADYQAALRAVMYHTNDDPNSSPRTVSFTANDGQADSNPETRTVNVTPVNDPPVLSGIEATPVAYTEGNTVALTGTLTINDPDSTNLASARVTISANYQSGEDFLTFTNTAKITGSFNATTGVMTLTGSDTIADYQTALRAVMYHTNDAPNSSPRTISFIANDGQADSNAQTRTVNVTPVNDPPLLSGIETTPLHVSANGSATDITATLLVADADNDNLTGATVTISTGYQNGKDVLAFTNTAKITGTFNAATGILTLTGIDTVSNYRAALRSVTYQNKDASAAPLTTTRTVTFQATDGASATADSNTVTRDIAIIPVLTGIETTPLSYSVNNDSTTKPAKAITSTLVIDADPSTTISGATIQITGSFQTGQDVLAFTAASGITGTFNATTGTLTLSGTASVAAYQAALRSVTYQNTSASTTGQTRTVTFTVKDSNSDTIKPVTRDIAVTSSTVVGGLETTPIAYTEGQAPVPVTSLLTITDPNGTTLSGATIKLTGFQTGDVLGFKNTAKITGTYDSTTGILTLTGKDTLANYQAALRSITYQNTTNNPGSTARTLSFQVGTTLLSTAVTRAIDVTPIVSVPVLSRIEQRILRHRHHRGPSQVAPTLTITDVDSTTLTGAKVQISNFHAGQDVLAFKKAGIITGTFDATTGILTLTGTDTIANYEAVLRSVTFDSSGRHIHGRRQISFEVSNGATQSVAGERTVRVR